MATHATETTDERGTDQRDDDGGRSRAKRALSAVTKEGRRGPAAMIAGGTLLARAARTMRRSKGRALLQALGGGALLAYGLRRRRSNGSDQGGLKSTGVDDEAATPDESVSTVDRRSESNEPDANPRGTENEPDVETKTDPDEGEITFTEDHEDEPHDRPHYEGDAPEDPRLDHPEDNDDDVEVDLSEVAMADEASEAAGPTPTQAQPAQTDEIEPERSADEDSSDEQSDETDSADSESDPDETDESVIDAEESATDDESNEA